jgi:hypothetical protein
VPIEEFRMSKEVTYQSSKDIIKNHGILVFILFILFAKLLRKVSLLYFLFSIPRNIRILSRLIEHPYNKIVPWWQDLSLIVEILLTPVAIIFAWTNNNSWIFILPIYLLCDLLIYFIDVLWFDDLMLGINKGQKKVWSHRRLLFWAIIAYIQVIFLFPIFYKNAVPQIAYDQLLLKSSQISTFMSLSQIPSFIDTLQVILSMFYISIFVGVTVSIAYQRDEIAPQ